MPPLPSVFSCVVEVTVPLVQMPYKGRLCSRPFVACWPLGLTPTFPQAKLHQGEAPRTWPRDPGSSHPYLFLFSFLTAPSMGQSSEQPSLTVGAFCLPSPACTSPDSSSAYLSAHRAWSCMQKACDWVCLEGSTPCEASGGSELYEAATVHLVIHLCIATR